MQTLAYNKDGNTTLAMKTAVIVKRFILHQQHILLCIWLAKEYNLIFKLYLQKRNMLETRKDSCHSVVFYTVDAVTIINAYKTLSL